ncbi:UbiA family prenyltransferase [Natrinema halophilum]|uniref:UbiA family prenyltransferase n=1 Tax=Natrinema halophilum TaxID=1699371 RepID=A0A7D5GG09_9EURY|nr:UbiA family prenyltransferase [Natrinema halophilum]QLG47988.1 UbiA family prenyltransferase [Natrinema halophilum]
MTGGVSSDRNGNTDAVDGEGGAAPKRGPRATLEAIAELVRIPNLFTAPPDVILGAALVAVTGHDPTSVTVGGLAIGSVILYAGGTTLNDAFDAPVDVRHRPDRPIPSGRVSRHTAFGLGFALLALAVGIAFGVAGRPAAVAAGLIAVAVVTYDGLLKGTTAGFLAMGTTRGLNVVLGTTAVGRSVFESPIRLLAVPAAVTGYIAAVTFMAARETEGENRGAVAVAAAGATAAVLTLGWHLVNVGPSVLESGVALAFAAAFCWWVGRPLRAAFADPVPSTVGPAVGACVLGLVLLDAGFAAAAGVGWGVATGAFLVPAVVSSRVIDVT